VQVNCEKGDFSSMQLREISSRLAVASAVAAMLAVSTSGAFAQTPDAVAPPMAPAPMAPAPMMSAPMASDPMSGSTPTDYKILSNRYFNYSDLSQARARGLSESEIASVVKIAKETGLPFREVSAAVERGETFPALATEYGIRLGDVYNVDKEKQDISDYTTLYESGLALGKSDSMMPAMASMPMTPAPMAPSSSTSMTPATTASGATLDIVDTAMAAKNLTTLVKALQIAGLVETLKGAGPFTVFAPTDRAFAKLPAGALDALEADPAKLKTVLTYHVIPASITASDAMSMTSPTSPPTVEGATLNITKGRRGRLKVNDATVIKADIAASNGVIHIIDAVLMPPMDATTPAPTDSTTPPAPAAPDATTPGTMAPAPVPGATDATPPAPAQ
jgi:uncharacterized surface protein with fasciclin (FAS1) repeats